MKFFKNIVIVSILGFLFLVSCKNNTETCTTCDGLFSQTVNVWVNNRLFDCGDGTGVKCFEAQVGDTVVEANWEVWSNSICGFDFQAGYVYELSCKRNKIGTDANGNKTYNYCLISILSKKQVFLK